LVGRSYLIEHVAEPLHPRQGHKGRSGSKFFGVDLLGQLGDDRYNLVQPTRMMLIADQIERGHLRRRNLDRAARRIETLNGHVLQVFADKEGNADLSALERT